MLHDWKLQDFLTVSQIRRCVELWDRHNHGGVTTLAFHFAVLKEVVEPDIATIARKLGRPVDPIVIAYLIDLALSRL